MARTAMLLLGALLLSTACSTVTVVAPTPAAEVSGRWIGVWRGVGMMNQPREETLEVELTQDGARGRGRMVWWAPGTADVPEAVRLAGAAGVPVVFAVSGVDVVLRHELGARRLTARLIVDGDEMTGTVTSGSGPVEIRLTREASVSAATTRERLAQLELGLDGERRRLTEAASGLRALGERVDHVAGVADGASIAARRAAETADAGSTRLAILERRTPEVGTSAPGRERRHARSIVRTLDVRFAFDRAELDDAAITALLDVVDVLKQNPLLLAELEGYTDVLGSRLYNLALSHRRVDAVQRYLAQRGVPLAQIHLVSFGALPDKAADKRVRNRRVTVKLVTDVE